MPTKSVKCSYIVNSEANLYTFFDISDTEKNWIAGGTELLSLTIRVIGKCPKTEFFFVNRIP